MPVRNPHDPALMGLVTLFDSSSPQPFTRATVEDVTTNLSGISHASAITTIVLGLAFAAVCFVAGRQLAGAGLNRLFQFGAAGILALLGLVLVFVVKGSYYTGQLPLLLMVGVPLAIILPMFADKIPSADSPAWNQLAQAGKKAAQEAKVKASQAATVASTAATAASQTAKNVQAQAAAQQPPVQQVPGQPMPQYLPVQQAPVEGQPVPPQAPAMATVPPPPPADPLAGVPEADLAAARDPQTPAAELQRLAATHPGLWDLVHDHPNAYDGLKDWINAQR